MTDIRTETAPLKEAEADRTVSLWAADAAIANAVQQVLQGAYATHLARTPQEAVEREAGVVLLLLPAPAEALCQALEEGVEPTAALQELQQQYSQVLAVQRRARQRVQLLDVAQLRQDPAAVLKAAGVGAAIEAQAGLSAAMGPSADAMMLLLARARLQADPALRRLVGEFEAVLRAEGLAEDRRADLDAALRLRQEDRDNQQEVILLQDQQRSMYEQIEVLYQEKRQLAQRLEQSRGGMDSFQAQSQALERQVEVLQSRLNERDAMLRVASEMVQKLEQGGARQDRSERVAELEAQILRFENSRSYRLMAPLRGLRRALRGQR